MGTIKPMLALSIALPDLPGYVFNVPDEDLLAGCEWEPSPEAKQKLVADNVAPEDWWLHWTPPTIDPDLWWMQPKADGHRFLVEVNDGVVTVSNRGGMPKVTGALTAALDQFTSFDAGNWIFDGELMPDGTIQLFDLAVAGGLVTPTTPFEERYSTLRTLVDDVWQPDPSKIQLLRCATTGVEKAAMVLEAKRLGREGVMLRQRSGVYRAGRRSWLLKCKFVKEGDFIVTAIKVGGHNNVELALLDPDDRYPKAHIKSMPGVAGVGRASANGKKPEPQVGDVWEVLFLYVMDHEKPRLYQPRLVRRRSYIENEVAQGDKFMDECLVDQLDHAFTDKDLTDYTKTGS
jgi:hypothetical protein